MIYWYGTQPVRLETAAALAVYDALMILRYQRNVAMILMIRIGLMK